MFQPGKRDAAFYQRYGLDGPSSSSTSAACRGKRTSISWFKPSNASRKRGNRPAWSWLATGRTAKNSSRHCAGRPIVFTGFLEGEELAAAYASADCMVFPSTTDTFGNVVLEAQASGVPVIVADRGGPPDIVRQHNSGIIVDVAQSESLVQAMDQLRNSPQLRDDLPPGDFAMPRSAVGRACWNFWSRDNEDLRGKEAGSADSMQPRLAPGVISMDLS